MITNEDKILTHHYLRNELDEDSLRSFESRLSTDEELKEYVDRFEQVFQKLKCYYSKMQLRSIIVKKLNSEERMEFIEVESSTNSMSSQNSNKKLYFQIAFTIVVSFLVSLGVFAVKEKVNQKDIPVEQVAMAIEEEDLSENETLLSDEPSDVRITGTAVNNMGFYVLPYSAVNKNEVFGSDAKMNNKLSMNVLWDDAAYGLAIVNFASRSEEKAKKLPYTFSKEDFFLGEEFIVVHNYKGKVKINKALVTQDDKGANSMMIRMQYPMDAYGALLMDDSGKIVAICDQNEGQEDLKAIKVFSLYKMTQEMNMNKGLPRMSISTANYLRNKNNAARMEALEGSFAWFEAQ